MGTVQQRSAEGERRDATRDPDTQFEVPDLSSVRRRVKRKFVNEAAFIRLRSELAAARPEFDLLADRVRSVRPEEEIRRGGRTSGGTEPKRDAQIGPERDAHAGVESWVKHGSHLLDEAKRALERGEIEDAWRYLHTARRFEVYGLDELDWWTEGTDQRSEIETRATTIREEALDSLGGWRRRAVMDLLCDDDGNLRDGITGSELRAASRVLHEQYESVYLARNERQRQFNQLVVMGALSGLALFALTLLDMLWGTLQISGPVGVVGHLLETPFGPTSETVPDITRPGFAVYMTVAGVVGASLFGMLSLKKRSISTKIPQQVSQLTVTGARGVIGAISALLFYFVLQTPVLDGAILADGVLTPSLMVVTGFAAGYTERLAPAVVGRIASITEADEPTTPKPDDETGSGRRERIENRPTTTTR